MTMEDDEDINADKEGNALVLGAQEWKWYLENLYLLAEQDEESEPQLTHEKSVATPKRSIACLPDDAPIYQVDQAIERDINILQSLSLLHRSHMYDVSTVQNSLLKAQSHRDVGLAKLELFTRQHEQAQADCQEQCSKLGLVLPDAIESMSSSDLAEFVDGWVETELRPRCLALVKEILCEQLKELQPIVEYHAEFCTRINNQDTKSLSQLPNLSEETDLEFDTFEKLMLELEGLESFLKGRILDCSKSDTAMTFMTQITSQDDKSTLEKYLKVIQTMLNKLKTTDPLVPWALLEGNRANVLKHLEIARARLVEAKTRVKQAESALTAMDTEIQSLEVDLEWCKERVEKLRKRLEQDICDLDEIDSRDVSIQL